MIEWNYWNVMIRGIIYLLIYIIFLILYFLLNFCALPSMLPIFSTLQYIFPELIILSFPKDVSFVIPQNVFHNISKAS